MRIAPASSKTVVVLLGNLNPLIFTPSWFAKNGVIGEQEGENAEIELIHRDVVKFNLEWLVILVEHGRFIAEIEQPPDIRLYDFISKTFGELLTHTPVWSMGINKRVDFDAGSMESKDKIGYTLAPPEAWGEWSKDIRRAAEDKDKHGGMMSLTMRQTTTDDRPGGYIQTKVEPSTIISTGVFVEVNDHYNLPQGEEIEGCHEIMKIFAENFEKSVTRSEWITDQVMSIIK